MKPRVAVVTGGAGGIGRAVVASLQADGVRVGVLDRATTNEADAAVEADVTEPSAVASALDSLESDLGPADYLVCAAGIVNERRLAALTPDVWRQVIEVSLTGTYLAVQHLVPRMVERASGSVVAISSGYARSGYAFGGHYAAAKAGIEAFVRSVAQEVGPAGVRVNAVAPGPVLTPFISHIEDQEAWRRDREARIPLRRLATPEDVVGPIRFLLSDQAGYVTGQVLQVNGGLLMT